MENPFKKKVIKNKIEEKLSKTSDTSLTLQGFAAGIMVVGGLELGKQIDQDITNDKKEIKKEIRENRKKAKSYSLENEKKLDLLKLLNDKFIEEVAEKIRFKKLMHDNNLTGFKNINEFDNFIKDIERALGDSSVIDSKELSKKYKGLPSIPTPEEKKYAKDRLISLIIVVELAKKELVEHLQSDEYLEKLAREMNISKEAAKEHQKVRVNNVNNLSYSFKSLDEIREDTKESLAQGYAYYNWGNEIVLPYDDFNKNVNKFFYESVLHEILHESTQYEEGMSNRSKDLLLNSHQYSNKDKNERDSAYFYEPGELIVRKIILDLEMIDLGIKEYGEEFTDAHYKKLLEKKEKGELSGDAKQFIDHIKPEKFSEVMNELAENKENDKTYYHPGWDYNNTENNT